MSMIAMNIIDNVEAINYGILVCENESVSENNIQDKICEIKKKMDDEGIDWEIQDIISGFPKDWKIHLQMKNMNIAI